MDEYIDILDSKTGEKTGEKVLKKIAHKEGIWHGSIHILIVDKSKTKTLLQKRCELKDLYPNTWDIAVGGHISFGENDIISAKRELKEELGLEPNDFKLNFLCKTKECLNNNNVISNEFVSIFIIYSDININDIVLQKEEVSEIKWCSKEELNKFIDEKIIIPHNKEYELLNDILK